MAKSAISYLVVEEPITLNRILFIGAKLLVVKIATHNKNVDILVRLLYTLKDT